MATTIHRKVAMTPWICDKIPEEDILSFERIRRSVILMPDIDLGLNDKGKKIILSCHMLARAVSKVFGLEYRDGFLKPNYDHSWILTPNGNIIDVYPIAMIGGPVLLSGDVRAPSRWQYEIKPARKIGRGDFSKSWFRRSVYLTVCALKVVTR